MKVTEKDVVYVADLANIQLGAEQLTSMVRDLNSILEYVDRLNTLDTTNVELTPLMPDGHTIKDSQQSTEEFSYATREDLVEGLRQSLPRDETLRNAPDADGTFFRVPKVIER